VPDPSNVTVDATATAITNVRPRTAVLLDLADGRRLSGGRRRSPHLPGPWSIRIAIGADRIGEISGDSTTPGGRWADGRERPSLNVPAGSPRAHGDGTGVRFDRRGARWERTAASATRATQRYFRIKLLWRIIRVQHFGIFGRVPGYRRIVRIRPATATFGQ
jgi:hypothetical protein